MSFANMKFDLDGLQRIALSSLLLIVGVVVLVVLPIADPPPGEVAEFESSRYFSVSLLASPVISIFIPRRFLAIWGVTIAVGWLFTFFIPYERILDCSYPGAASNGLHDECMFDAHLRSLPVWISAIVTGIRGIKWWLRS